MKNCTTLLSRTSDTVLLGCVAFCDDFLGAGFGGHVPFGYASFGKTNEAMTNSALCDFTSNYRKRLSTEWAPVTISRADPPLLIQPSEIYHKHIGQLPNYGGHIPGAIFRWVLLVLIWYKSGILGLEKLTGTIQGTPRGG
jgi:hypothetical protein